ncbi:MAG: glycosyltransferase [Pseudomonadota bacterium]
MDYVIAVQAPAYPLSATRFATESAFAEHLKELRHSIGPRFQRVVLVAPSLNSDHYDEQKSFLGTVDAEEDGIVFMPAYPSATSARHFWSSHALPLWRRLKAAVATAGVVHAGMSTDTWRPMMAMVNLAAWRAKRPVIFFVDIDFRKHSWRFYKLGVWNLKNYIVNRVLHDPLKWLQCWLAPRMFKLVLLKSASMVRDFGQGRANVKNFFDTAHSMEQVLTDEELRRRQTWLRDPSGPLRLVYFGRLVPYKGLDRVVEAVGLARAQGLDVRFTLIGSGESLPALQAQVEGAGLSGAVEFLPQVPYGKELFDQLEQVHFTVATPLVEDTPRAAFDSMARGIPILAFDITYFRDLAQASRAVVLAEWPSPQALATQMIERNRERGQIARMAQDAVAFACDNTQKKWLDQRMRWTLELAMDQGVPPDAPMAPRSAV